MELSLGVGLVPHIFLGYRREDLLKRSDRASVARQQSRPAVAKGSAGRGRVAQCCIGARSADAFLCRMQDLVAHG
jgi:hypothetical protein